MKQLEAFAEKEGEPGFAREPWYNPDGDCLIFKSENVAAVAERVDGVLTIYESAKDGRAIGFKIKGVKHLLRDMGCHAMAVGAAADQSGEIVTVVMVLLQAFSGERPSIARREGYTRALETFSPRVPVLCSEAATP